MPTLKPRDRKAFKDEKAWKKTLKKWCKKSIKARKKKYKKEPQFQVHAYLAVNAPKVVLK